MYLEGSKAQLEHKPLPLADIFRREGEHGVVNTKERDEQEGGACQTPEQTTTNSLMRLSETQIKVVLM